MGPTTKEYNIKQTKNTATKNGDLEKEIKGLIAIDFPNHNVNQPIHFGNRLQEVLLFVLIINSVLSGLKF